MVSVTTPLVSRTLAGRVDLVLGGSEPGGDQRFDRVGGPADDKRQFPALSRAEVTEHEVGRILPAWRPANADPDPVIVARPQGRRDRPQAIMAVVTAPELQPDRLERKLKRVVYHSRPLTQD